VQCHEWGAFLNALMIVNVADDQTNCWLNNKFPQNDFQDLQQTDQIIAVSMLLANDWHHYTSVGRIIDRNELTEQVADLSLKVSNDLFIGVYLTSRRFDSRV